MQNEVLFFVRNLDRNAARTTYITALTIHIVDPQSETTLMTRNLITVDAPTALYKLVILASETADWETGALRWSITVTRVDGSITMLWTDRNYGPYSVLEVTPGPIPGPASPIVMTPATFTLRNYQTFSPLLPGAAQLGYQGGLQTFAIYPANFTGTIEIDVSLASTPTNDGDWYGVSMTSYTATSDLATITILGNYLWLRVVISQPTSITPNAYGSITQILYKN